MKERSWLFQRRIAAARAFLNSDSGKRILTRAMPDAIEIVGIRAKGNLFLTRPVDGIARELLRKGEWFGSETACCLRYFESVAGAAGKAVALEIGGHIGTQTVQLAQSDLFEVVVTVEPLPESYRLLSANLLLNDVADKVRTVNCGADVKAGLLEVYSHPRNIGASALFAAGDGRMPMGYQVPVKPVADILAQAGVDAVDVTFLWLDAEGMEARIFASCVEAGIRPAMAVIEFSPSLYGREGTARFVEDMARNFREVRRLDQDGLRKIEWSALAAIERQIDIVLTHPT